MKYDMLIAVLLYEILLIGGIGYWLAYKQKKEVKAEFLLAGRDMPLHVLGPTLALTVLGAAHVIGVFEMTWYFGAASIWFGLATMMSLVVVCLSTGLWVRRLGVTTLPEMLEILFGPGVRIAAACVTAGAIFGVLTLETQGMGIILSSMTGWSIRQGAVAGGILGVLYIVMAGMKEIGWINLVNVVVMYVGLIASTIYLAMALPNGDFSSVEDFYVSEGNEYMLSIFATPDIMIGFSLATIVVIVFSLPAYQNVLQPAMSAKNEKTIIHSVWIAAPLNGLFGVFAVVIALTAKSLPEFSVYGAKGAATAMLINILPGWLATLLIASFLAAVLSTFAMSCLCPATIFSNDIYKKYYKPSATDADMTRVTRISIILLASIAIAIAAYLPPILAAINWLMAWIVPMFILLIIGLFWKRNSDAALLTLGIAWLINSAWSFTKLPTYLNLKDVPNSYVVLFVTLFVGISLNFFMPGEKGYFRSKEYDAKYNVE